MECPKLNVITTKELRLAPLYEESPRIYEEILSSLRNKELLSSSERK
jgi:hypothetical protein